MKRVAKPKCWLLVTVLLTGCSHELVKDDTRRTSAGTSHCSGSEWTDDSSMSILPIPVVAFFMPHADMHDIEADNYLKRCGDVTRLVNRTVVLGHTACVPAGLTRVLTLGVWQWCPAHVTWEADVLE